MRLSPRARCLARAAVVGALAAGPDAAGAPRIAVSGAPVIAGELKPYKVEIHDDADAAESHRPLRVAVNVGAFGPVQRVGPGRHETTYRPPARFPQVALVALWRETGPDAPVEFVRILVHARTTLPVASDPGAQVTVRVGSADFGPVQTDAAGRAQVPVVVPPGVREAAVTATVHQGVSSRKTQPLEVPPYNRLTLAVVPHAVVADGRSFARVHVFYDAPSGAAPTVDLRASEGELVPDAPPGPGRAAFRYLPQSGARGPVTLTAAVAGDPHASATAQIALGQTEPARLAIVPPRDPPSVGHKEPAEFRVLVADAAGLGIVGADVALEAPGLAIVRRRELGGGLYAFDATVSRHPAQGVLKLRASLAARSGPALLTTAEVRVRVPRTAASARFDAAPEWLKAGGPPVDVVASVFDAAGQPAVGGARLEAAGASLTRVQEAEGQLVAQVVPPRGPGQVTLKVVGADGEPLAEREISVQGDARRGYAALRLGAAANPGASLGPWGAIEVGYRPRLLDDVLVASASFGAIQSAAESQPTGITHDLTAAILSLRLALDDLEIGRVRTQIGLAVLAAVVAHGQRVAGTVPPPDAHAAVGAGVFLAAAVPLGPGHAAIEIGYGFALVRAADLTANASALTVDVGYRLPVF